MSLYNYIKMIVAAEYKLNNGTTTEVNYNYALIINGVNVTDGNIFSAESGEYCNYYIAVKSCTTTITTTNGVSSSSTECSGYSDSYITPANIEAYATNATVDIGTNGITVTRNDESITETTVSITMDLDNEVETFVYNMTFN